MDFLKDFLPSWLPPWAAAAAVGAVIAFWNRLREMVTRLSTHLVDIVKVDADLAAECLTHFGKAANTSRFGGRSYMVLSRFVRSKARQTWILSRWIDKDGRMTFWVPYKGWKVPLWVDRGKEGNQMTFRFLRGTLDFEALLKGIVERVNLRKENRYRIIRVGGAGQARGGNDGSKPGRPTSDGNSFTDRPATSFYLTESPDDIGEPKSQGGPEDLWLHTDVRHILEDARQWFRNRGWYQEHRLPWRRGYLAHGVPGTGKTSLARAIGIDLDIPVYAVDLQSLTNSELTDAFTEARQNAPCMILIEDLDSVYRCRTAVQPNVQLGTPPSFDHLLNQIQGVGSNDGLLTFLTTNHLETVDFALGGPCRQGADGQLEVGEVTPRPGRVDRVLHTPNSIDQEGRLFLARRMLPEAEAQVISIRCDGMTPAQFQEELLRRAQELL